MKGYHKLRIRRAATGAIRDYAFHNHIMPGFYDILMAKSVSDNNNSVIDTLVLGDGVGSHPANATVLNGTSVFEKKYNEYRTPIDLSAASASTEFAHELHFNAFHTGDIIRVGEIAIGAYVGDVFKIASLTHIKDSNGEPTTIVLMPGDELSLVWTFTIARPAFLPGYETTKPDYLVYNVYSYTGVVKYGIDYEMLSAYPNWHLMGLKRILTLIASRNSLITKTTWQYLKYNQTTTNWTEVEPTIELLTQGNLRFFTDNTDPLYTAPTELYSPSLLAPIKMSWNTTGVSFNNMFYLKLTMDDLYSRWEGSFKTPDSKIAPPSVVSILNVTYTTTPENYEVRIQTTPYVIVTVYKDGIVAQNLLSDEFGICKFTLNRRSVLSTYQYLIRAHVNGHQLTETISFPTVTVESPNLISSDGYLIDGSYNHAPHVLRMSIAPSALRRTYRLTGVATLTDQTRTYAATLNQQVANYGDITVSATWTGEFKVGDKLSTSLIDVETGLTVETYEFTVHSLPKESSRKGYQSVSDQLLFKVKAYNVTV